MCLLVSFVFPFFYFLCFSLSCLFRHISFCQMCQSAIKHIYCIFILNYMFSATISFYGFQITGWIACVTLYYLEHVNYHKFQVLVFYCNSLHQPYDWLLLFNIFSWTWFLVRLVIFFYIQSLCMKNVRGSGSQYLPPETYRSFSDSQPECWQIVSI